MFATERVSRSRSRKGKWRKAGGGHGGEDPVGGMGAAGLGGRWRDRPALCIAAPDMECAGGQVAATASGVLDICLRRGVGVPSLVYYTGDFSTSATPYATGLGLVAPLNHSHSTRRNAKRSRVVVCPTFSTAKLGPPSGLAIADDGTIYVRAGAARGDLESRLYVWAPSASDPTQYPVEIVGPKPSKVALDRATGSFVANGFIDGESGPQTVYRCGAAIATRRPFAAG
jgi:hypothetical protein